MLHKMILTPSVLVATAIAALATTSTASAGKLGCINPSDCRCDLSSKEVDVEKSCFEVECKTICIPKVVFLWQPDIAASVLGYSVVISQLATPVIHQHVMLRLRWQGL